MLIAISGTAPVTKAARQKKRSPQQPAEEDQVDGAATAHQHDAEGGENRTDKEKRCIQRQHIDRCAQTAQHNLREGDGRCVKDAIS